MPFARDLSWNYTTATAGTTIQIPLPSYEVGDLLLAIITADTGAGTWSASGWTLLFAQTNTCQQAMLWKYAAASEPDPTFASTVGETYNGCIVSIGDVHPSTPFGATPIRTTATQAAAAKYAMPQVTTNAANALLIYAASNSGAGVPSLLEGPVFGLLGADGAAESMGVGWGFKAVAGLTPANVTCSNVVSGTGLKTVLQIAPPAGGAQVIPAYCPADASQYIDPINGVTAYNGNTALAANADTNFGTTLGGIGANDATAASLADTGINSFHSCGQLTTVSASKLMSGAELALAVANRPNVSGKNVLVHISPSTEGQLQRFSSAATGRGAWFGMRNAAGVYKIWQVYGANVPGALNRHVPVIINNLAGDTVASAGTLDPTAIQALGFWFSGSGVLTTIWRLASLWALDTTTVCGGNAAAPVGVSGIVAAAATGKERRSVLLQGANQALVLQPLQFGDGGSNPLYLDLDATAIEFPRLYNRATAEVTYNSAPNVAGLTYHGGAGDTVKHRNSVISSASPYHWRIHASASASATWDFSGLSVIGAGDVVLRNVTTFAGMSFTGCDSITQNSAPLSGCNLAGSPVLSNAPGAVSDCTFTSGGTGHALEITTPGTYTFAGNTFSGYGTAGTADAAVYNNSGGAVTLNISGGGGTPTVRNGAGASTVVNNSVTLTLTGLQTGSDIVILNAGTSTIREQVDAHPTTSYPYAFSTGGTVDIGVLKAGFVPLYVRGYPLPVSDASLPISQSSDRNYL